MRKNKLFIKVFILLILITNTFLVPIKAEDSTSAFINRLYNLCLDRQADASGLDFYVSRLNNGEFNAAQVVKGFFESPEFLNKSLNDNDYIEICYKAMMNRNSDLEGKNYWLNILDNGVSRNFVLAQFVRSNEFSNICNNYGVNKGEIVLNEYRDQNYGISSFIARCYKLVLERKYDIAGMNYYAEALINKKLSASEMINNFLFSPEALNKNLSDSQFIEICYRVLMNRNFDTEGKNYWLQHLNNGVSRKYILNGFIGSNEFSNICNNYGVNKGKITLDQYRDSNYPLATFLANCYSEILGRRYDDNGLEEFAKAILTNKKQRSEAINVVKSIYNSNEFKNRNLSNRDFVITLYRGLWSYIPSDNEINIWLNKLNNSTREKIIIEFTNTKEFQAILDKCSLIDEKDKPESQSYTPVYYAQNDASWGSKKYGRWNMASSGCVPTSIAMVAQPIIGRYISPTEVAGYLYNNGLYNNGIIGAGGYAISSAASQYGFSYQVLYSSQDTKDALNSGKMVIAMVGPGKWCGRGTTHSIVLFGGGDNTNVYDPLGANGSFGVDYIWSQRSYDSLDNQLGSPFIAIFK